MHSNSYIFKYAAIMVVIVAVLLSTTAVVLKPFQKANEKKEKMSMILNSVSVYYEGKDIAELYEQTVVKELAVGIDGNIKSIFEAGKLVEGNVRAFDIELKKELAKSEADINLPVFVCKKSDGELNYVFPVLGKGLWGPVWGNIALKADLNTLVGVNFAHKSETPGLGAEIVLPSFTDQFKNKKIFDENGDFVSVKVVKGGVEGSKIPLEHGVDGMSGSTETCKGVSLMIDESMTNYINYIKQNSSN